MQFAYRTTSSPHHLARAETIGIKYPDDMDYLLWFEETTFSLQPMVPDQAGAHGRRRLERVVLLPRWLRSGSGCRCISAACGEQWDVAERHFQIALEQAHEMPVRSEQPEVRRWYARMLLDRRQPGDEDRARELLDEAILMYEEIGMPRHLEMAREML